MIAPDVGLSAQFGTVFPRSIFRYQPCANSLWGILRVTTQLLRREKFDLINAQGFTSALVALLPAMLFAHGIPRLLTVHDVLHATQFRGWRGGVKRWLMAQAFKRYQCIVPVSHDCEQNILAYLPEVAGTQIQTITNGVSVGRLQASHALLLREQLAVDGSRFLIGFMGRFMAQKGFRYLVDAVEALSKEPTMTRQPLVVCYGSGGFHREEKAAIEARGLGDYFRFFDHIEDVGAAMKALDVVAMPSLWEACPLLPMEVLICGTPLIASNCIGLREVVAGTPAWVVTQADATALADALQAAARDDRRAEFEAYAPQAAQRFDVATTRSALAALYDELLEGRR